MMGAVEWFLVITGDYGLQSGSWCGAHSRAPSRDGALGAFDQKKASGNLPDAFEMLGLERREVT
jgi:hypothetical protein